MPDAVPRQAERIVFWLYWITQRPTAQSRSDIEQTQVRPATAKGEAAMRIMDRMIKTIGVTVINNSERPISFTANNGAAGIHIKPGEQFISESSPLNPNPFRVLLSGRGKFATSKTIIPGYSTVIYVRNR